MLKSIAVQFGKALCIFFAIAMVVFGLQAAAGHFRIDIAHGSHGALGVYDSVLIGSPAYYNPGIFTISAVEIISLLLMPIVLPISRRYIQALKDVSIIPWVLVLATLAVYTFALVVWPGFSAHEGSPDLIFESALPYFLQMQIPVAIGLTLGYALLAWKLKATVNKDGGATS
jgi:hypothetical protein